MKNLIKSSLLLIISFISCMGAFAQTTTTTTQNTVPTTLQDSQTRFSGEQTNNETLNQQYQAERDAHYQKPISDTSGVLGDKPHVNYDPENLTDTEKEISEKFVHQGIIDDKMKELCNGREMEQACAGQEVKHDFMGMDTKLVEALSKAYTAVVGAGLGGGEFTARGASDAKATADTKTDTNAASKDGKYKEGKDDKDGKQEDYCKYIAIATEVIALFQQEQEQKNLSDQPTNADTAQKDMLLRAARSHEERAENAKIQRNGWGITAACYTGMIAFAEVDWNLGLKLASSYLMTAFFQNEVKHHEEYRDKVLAIATKLPGRGDCNPITERDCYCTHETTKNDPQYCTPYLHQAAIAATSIRTTCVNNNMKADPQCSCRATRTCFDQTFLKLTGDDWSGSAKGLQKPVTSMMNGEMLDGAGDLGAINGQNAINSALRKLDAQAKPTTLTNKDKGVAKAINNLGIPAKLAGLLSQAPSSAKGNNFANGVQASGGSYSAMDYSGGNSGNDRNRVLSFSGGDALGSRRARSNNNSSKNNRKAKKAASAEVLRFAEKATREADINKDPSKPIFEIISRRYQISAPRRLELE